MIGKVVGGFTAGALVCLIGGPLAAHFGLVPPLAGMAVFLLSGVLGLLALASGTHAALHHQAYFFAMIGMLGCLPFIAVTAGIVEALRHPAINDISTDLNDPPAFTRAATLPENRGRDLTFPADFVTTIRQYYPTLKPLRLNQGPEQVYRKARSLAQNRPFNWTLTEESEAPFGFEAVAPTRLFRWLDDVVVRIRPDGDGGSIVDMRSKSRQGKGDLGANERRIRRFWEALAE